MYGNGLNRSTAKSINQQIDKLICDLGDPEPPLKLEHVRHLLTLDRIYYSSDDHSLFARAFHRMTIAGKQLVNRPGLIKDTGAAGGAAGTQTDLTGEADLVSCVGCSDSGLDGKGGG